MIKKKKIVKYENYEFQTKPLGVESFLVFLWGANIIGAILSDNIVSSMCFFGAMLLLIFISNGLKRRVVEK